MTSSYYPGYTLASSTSSDHAPSVLRGSRGAKPTFIEPDVTGNLMDEVVKLLTKLEPPENTPSLAALHKWVDTAPFERELHAWIDVNESLLAFSKSPPNATFDVSPVDEPAQRFVPPLEQQPDVVLSPEVQAASSLRSVLKDSRRRVSADPTPSLALAAGLVVLVSSSPSPPTEIPSVLSSPRVERCVTFPSLKPIKTAAVLIREAQSVLLREPSKTEALPSSQLDLIAQDILPRRLVDKKLPQYSTPEQAMLEEMVLEEVGRSIVLSFVYLFFTFYTFYSIPWRVAFQSGDLPWAVLVADYVSDLVFVAFVFQAFRTPFEDAGLWVMDRAKIRRRYMLQGTFALDLIAFLPIELVQIPTRGRSYSPWLRCNRMLSIIHYNRCFGLLFEIIAKRIHPSIARLLKVFVTCFIVVHLFAATFCGIMERSPTEANIEFIGLSMGEDMAIAHRYFIGLWWCIAAMCGYNPTRPQTDEQTFFATLVAVVGLGAYATTLTVIGMVIDAIEHHSRIYREKIDAVKDHLTHARLPKFFQSEVLEYYRQMWRACKNFTNENIFQDLPMGLKEDVQFAMNFNLIKKIPLFQRVEDEDFIADVVTALRMEVVLPGACVVKQGDDGSAMYFVAKGELSVERTQGSEVTTIALLKEGDYFGEVALLYGLPRNATVRANTFCTVYRLCIADFDDIVKDYPGCLMEVLETAENRLRERDDLENIEHYPTPQFNRVHRFTIRKSELLDMSPISSLLDKSPTLHPTLTSNIRRGSAARSFHRKRRSSAREEVESIDSDVPPVSFPSSPPRGVSYGRLLFRRIAGSLTGSSISSYVDTLNSSVGIHSEGTYRRLDHLRRRTTRSVPRIPGETDRDSDLSSEDDSKSGTMQRVTTATSVSLTPPSHHLPVRRPLPDFDIGPSASETSLSTRPQLSSSTRSATKSSASPNYSHLNPLEAKGRFPDDGPHESEDTVTRYGLEVSRRRSSDSSVSSASSSGRMRETSRHRALQRAYRVIPVVPEPCVR